MIKVKPFWKKSFIILISMFICIAYIISSYAADGELKSYQKIAQQSDLIIQGRIHAIELKDELFGWTDNQPYYATYQYITININNIIKGTPRLEPLVFRSTSKFVRDPKFKKGEEVIVMLKWYETETYGNYYALVGGREGTFYVEENSSGDKVVFNQSMGEKWKKNLKDFLKEI